MTVTNNTAIPHIPSSATWVDIASGFLIETLPELSPNITRLSLAIASDKVPAFPPSLTHLKVLLHPANKVISKVKLPAALIHLECDFGDNAVHDISGLVLPSALQFLKLFSFDFQDAVLPQLPSSLRYLWLEGGRGCGSMGPNFINIHLPPSLTHLRLLFDFLSRDVQPLPLFPPGLLFLELRCDDFVVLPPLPASLLHLVLPEYEIPLNAYPPNLRYLEETQAQFRDLPPLPASITTLKFVGLDYDIPAIPAGVTTFYAHRSFDAYLPIENPPNITHLTIRFFPDGANIPASVTHLRIDAVPASVVIPALPNKLEFLEMTCEGGVISLPDSLKHLSLTSRSSPIKPFARFPPNLTSLYLSNFDLPLPPFPRTLEQLRIDDEVHNNTIIDVLPPLPPNLFSLWLSSKCTAPPLLWSEDPNERNHKVGFPKALLLLACPSRYLEYRMHCPPACEFVIIRG